MPAANLLQAARSGGCDVVVAEALDRLSRDQEHVAALCKQISFAGVRVVTLAEGAIGELHVGLKGTINALFLKDLADKTRRGLRGRVEKGRSGGRLCYGYRVEREYAPDGSPRRGGRAIDPQEAAVVREIFQTFAAGASPRTTIRGDELETIVFDGLRGGLMDPDLFKAFAEAFHAEVNRGLMQQRAGCAAAEQELQRIDIRIRRTLDLLLDRDDPPRSLLDDLRALEARKDEISAKIAAMSEPGPFLHPNLAEVYRSKSRRTRPRAQASREQEAFELIRSLIETIRLVPGGRSTQGGTQGRTRRHPRALCRKRKEAGLDEPGFCRTTI